MSVTPETLEKVKNDVTTAIDLLKKDKDWSIGSITGKVDILQAVLVEVEKTAKEIGTLTGKDKKKLAIDVINIVIDIPMVPEWAEAVIIEYVIDIVIALLNKWFGHAWLDKFLK